MNCKATVVSLLPFPLVPPPSPLLPHPRLFPSRFLFFLVFLLLFDRNLKFIPYFIRWKREIAGLLYLAKGEPQRLASLRNFAHWYHLWAFTFWNYIVSMFIFLFFLAILKSENRGDSFLHTFSLWEVIVLVYNFIYNWVRYPVIGLSYLWICFKLTKTYLVFTLKIMVLISCEEEIQSECI